MIAHDDRTRPPTSLATLWLVVTVVTLASSCQRASRPVIAAPIAGDGTCLYSGHLIDRLGAFGEAIGRPIDCAMVFNNAAPTWDDLVTPWFVVHGDANLNWAEWKRAEPQRRLIISQALVPDQVPDDWRERGAAGEYDEYAKALATQLVSAGLGDSVIRLSHESNGLWTKDGLGPDPTRYDAWRQTWRRFAAAMRTVPGADFQFDWTINPGVRPIPFDAYYPGDDAVDIIGVDVYDYWEDDRFGPAPPDQQTRWNIRFREPAGVGQLVEFAAEHDKPLSIPEWAIRPEAIQGGIGDNPSFVEHVARLIDDRDVVYHAYFEKSAELLLVDSPRSFAVYREAFGNPDASTVPSTG